MTTEYSIVTGYFVQDDPKADGGAIGAIPERFGLKDSSPDRWVKFESSLSILNEAAPPKTKYKMLFFARHGEGVHNVAEKKYGSEAWNAYWSKLNGDGDFVWGPDPSLTTKGIQQAADACEAWRTERAHGVPLPQKHYASPMQRALETFHETFVQVPIDGQPLETTILENLREEYGEHTCDLRSPRTLIAGRYPPPVYGFESGFEEEDVLWKADERETKRHVAGRAKLVMDRIFKEDDGTFICITAHSGIINGFLAAMGRPRYALPTGGILPLIVKAVEL